MIKYKLLLITLYILHIFIQGQQIYQPLLSEGEIPHEFILKPGEKFLSDIQKIDKSKSRSEKQTEKDFYLQSNYILDYYYRSGRVCFNNQLNKYVNKVADYLLKNDKELRSEIKFYILKNTDFNAFTTNDGTIFINIGLLAKIQNEAQLAFIIAHEIAHYINNHTIDAFIEQVKLVQGEKDYKGLNYDQKKVKLSDYSKEQEFIADREGLTKFFSNTNYTLEAVKNLFNTTLYSYLPLGQHDSIYNIFETDDLLIPSEYKLKDVDPIIVFEDYNDSLSSHPNIKKRKENLDSLILSMHHKGNLNFIISEEEFDSIQKIARFELTHLYLQTLSYEEAVCNSHFLLQEYNDNKYAEVTIGIALMQLANYKVNDDFFYIHKDYKEIQASSQKLYFILEKMSDKELGVLALTYNWKLKQKYPDCSIIETIIERILKTLVIDLGFNSTDFSETINPDSEFYKKAIASYLNDKDFHDKFIEYEELKKKMELEKEELIRNKEMRQLIAKENKMIQKKGFALGIDTIVIVNPLSISANYWKKDLIELDKSDNMRYKLVDAIFMISERINLHTTLLDLKYFKNTNIEHFNDYCLLSNWFSEKCFHYSDDYFLYNTLYTDYLIKKYNTRYFAWVGLYQEKDLKLINSQRTILDFYLFNIETGEMLLSQREWINAYENESMISTPVKKILNQIKNKRE